MTQNIQLETYLSTALKHVVRADLHKSIYIVKSVTFHLLQLELYCQQTTISSPLCFRPGIWCSVCEFYDFTDCVLTWSWTVCSWLISLRIMPSASFMACHSSISFFVGWIISHCVNVSAPPWASFVMCWLTKHSYSDKRLGGSLFSLEHGKQTNTTYCSYHLA